MSVAPDAHYNPLAGFIGKGFFFAGPLGYTEPTIFMDGILRCSRYAFGPNRLHYCGPDRNSELFAHIENNETDPDLTKTLSQFETMYPYLVHIATANHIADPFDPRVVEAYWIGNTLLDRIEKHSFYTHLIDGLGLKKKLGASFALVGSKVGDGALPHHSFHVFEVWKRTGHVEREHTLAAMDDCRISWGEVVKVSGPSIFVSVAPLLEVGGKLALGMPVEKKYLRQLESDYDIEQLRPGDFVTIHWNIICERITKDQRDRLKKYTLRHLAIANETY